MEEGATVSRSDLTLHLVSYREDVAAARLEEIREVVRCAAASERGVVALAHERASLLDEGTQERAEAEGFVTWAQRQKSRVTQAAIQRQAEAETAYNLLHRMSARGHRQLDDEGDDPSTPYARSREASRQRSPQRDAYHSPRSPTSPGDHPKKWPTPAGANLSPRGRALSAYGPGATALFEHLRPSDESGGVPRVRLLRSEWIIARAQKLRAAKTQAQKAALTWPCRQELEAAEPNAYYRAYVLTKPPNPHPLLLHLAASPGCALLTGACIAVSRVWQ